MRSSIKALALAFVFALPAFAAAEIGDIRMDSKVDSMHKAGVDAVIFPHKRHEKVFKCNACHPKIFKDKRGANDISMKLNMEGKFCGSADCHNSPKAHALFECAKCHTGVKKVK